MLPFILLTKIAVNYSSTGKMECGVRTMRNGGFGTKAANVIVAERQCAFSSK